MHVSTTEGQVLCNLRVQFEALEKLSLKIRAINVLYSWKLFALGKHTIANK